MDFTRTDDVAFELATVLDEMSAVHGRKLKHPMKKRIVPVSCAYFLQSEYGNPSSQAPYELMMKRKDSSPVGVDPGYIDDIAGIGFIYSMPDSEKNKAAMGSEINLQKDSTTESVVLMDMDAIDKFGGLMLRTYSQDIDLMSPENLDKAGNITPEPNVLKSSDGEVTEEEEEMNYNLLLDKMISDITADDEALPLALKKGIENVEAQAPMPLSTDIREILTTAKQHMTNEDILKLNEISNTLNSLQNTESSYTDKDDVKVSGIGSSIIDELLQQSVLSTPETNASEKVPSAEEMENFRWLSICKDSKTSENEPEDQDLGWIVTPNLYSEYADTLGDVEYADDFSEICETADVYVDSIIDEAAIVVNSWLRAVSSIDERSNLSSVSGNLSNQTVISDLSSQKQPDYNSPLVIYNSVHSPWSTSSSVEGEMFGSASYLPSSEPTNLNVKKSTIDESSESSTRANSMASNMFSLSSVSIASEADKVNFPDEDQPVIPLLQSSTDQEENSAKDSDEEKNLKHGKKKKGKSMISKVGTWFSSKTHKKVKK